MAAVALAAIAAALVLVGLRPDRQILGPLVLWAPVLARAVAGTLLILLALREGVPGLSASSPLSTAALLGPPILLAILAEWVAFAAGSEMPMMKDGMGAGNALGCFTREVLLVVPAFLLLGLLLARAYPLRPTFAATAGALGAGLIADAALYLTCPINAVSHTLLVHGGAVAALALTAAAIGWAFGGLRFRPRRSLYRSLVDSR